MKRRETNPANARSVGSVSAAPAADATDTRRAEGVGPPAHEAIARRAYELYLERGAEPERDIEDWLQAEAELRDRRQ
jgi:hypothetical protein